MKQVFTIGFFCGIIMLGWDVAIVLLNWMNRPGEAYSPLVNLMILAVMMVILMRSRMLQKHPMDAFNKLFVMNVQALLTAILVYFLGTILLYHFAMPNYAMMVAQDKAKLLEGAEDPVNANRIQLEIEQVYLNFSYKGLFVRKFVLSLIQSIPILLAVTSVFKKKVI